MLNVKFSNLNLNLRREMRELVSEYLIALGEKYAEGDTCIEDCSISAVKGIIEQAIDNSQMTDDMLDKLKKLSLMARELSGFIESSQNSELHHNVIPINKAQRATY